jgi:hypothetical protein
VPSEWTAEFLKVHIQNRFSRGAGKDEVEKGLYELNYRHNRELVLDLDDEGSVLRAQQNLIMSIMLLGSSSDDSNCPIDSCGSRNTELDPAGRRQW